MPIYDIKLSPLSQRESLQLLSSLYPDVQQNSKLQLSNSAGGIPLLLEVLGSLLKEGVYEEDLLLKLEATSILALVNNTLTDSSNYYKILKAIFDSLDPDLKDTFLALATIPMSFNQVTANVVVTISLRKKINLVPLVNYNLLKRFTSITGDRRFEMHPVFREFCTLVAQENPWWSLRQYISASVYDDYHKFHNAEVYKFWTQLDNTLQNVHLNKPDVNILSQQFANSLSSLNFFGRDELFVIVNHCFRFLYLKF